MKRRLELKEHTGKKMLKWNTTELESMDISDITSVGGSRRFNFKLTDEKAKKNLLKSAQRKHFEIEEKQNCMNLRFSPGAYIIVAKKMIDQCEIRYKEKSTFVYEDLEVKVEEFRTGHEANNKHFDTKIVFSVNNRKVVMHCYNSTQNFKVDGVGHSNFVSKFLEPLFRAQVEDVTDDIILYDKNVVNSLCGPGDKPKNEQTTSISKCITSSILPLESSTRNNSFSNEVLLCEDASLDEDENADEIEEFVDEHEGKKSSPDVSEDTDVRVADPEQSEDNSKKCDYCCFSTKSESDLKTHTQLVHKKISVDVSSIVYHECNFCDFKCKFNIQMKKHVQKYHDNNEEVSEPKYSCRDCDFTSHYYLYMWEHREQKHASQSEHPSDSKDMAMALIVEQNIDAYFQHESFKKYMEEKLQVFSNHFETKIEAIKKDMTIANAIHLDAISSLDVKCSSHEHTNDAHENVSSLKVVEKQVNEMCESIGNGALLNFMKDVPKVQNEIKQELFLIRNNQATSKSRTQDEAQKNPLKSSKSYANVVSKEKDRNQKHVENSDSRKNENFETMRERNAHRGSKSRSRDYEKRPKYFGNRQYNYPHKNYRSTNNIRFRDYDSHSRHFPHYRQNFWPRSHRGLDDQYNFPRYRDGQSTERLPRRYEVIDRPFYERNTFREPFYNSEYRFGQWGNY